MAEQQTVKPNCPLENTIYPGRFGAMGTVGVTLGRRSVSDLWQVAGWDDFEGVISALLAELGFKDLGTYRQFQRAGEVTLWRVAPEKILIENAGSRIDHANRDLAVLDLSHARIAITLSGPKARDLLSQLIAVDVTEEAFGEGDFLQTGIHHVGVLVQSIGSHCFEILVPYTWAETVWEAIAENALPHGLAVKDTA